MKTNNSIKIILFLCSFCLEVFAQKVSIPNIHIEASGNNAFEAKIRANKIGIRQSINLFLDKMGIGPFDVKQLSLPDIKNICQASKVDDEDSQEFFYSATVDYTCDSSKLRKSLAANQDVQKINNLHEVLVIPVLKSKGQYLLWKDASIWHDRWQDYESMLNQSGILLAKQDPRINSQNILRLNYHDIIEIYHDKLFNKVVIAICDIFEKRGSLSRIHMKYKFLNEDSSKIEEEEYPEIETSLDGVQMTFDDIINSFYDSNGQAVFLSDLDLAPREEESQPQELDEQYSGKKYTLYIDGYDKGYVEKIKKAMKKISKITNMNFTSEAIGLWKVELWGGFDDDEEFAESLYLQGLTYRKTQDSLRLIKLDKGV
jgi:hypothetical protein